MEVSKNIPKYSLHRWFTPYLCIALIIGCRPSAEESTTDAVTVSDGRTWAQTYYLAFDDQYAERPIEKSADPYVYLVGCRTTNDPMIDKIISEPRAKYWTLADFSQDKYCKVVPTNLGLHPDKVLSKDKQDSQYKYGRGVGGILTQLAYFGLQISSTLVFMQYLSKASGGGGDGSGFFEGGPIGGTWNWLYKHVFSNIGRFSQFTLSLLVGKGDSFERGQVFFRGNRKVGGQSLTKPSDLDRLMDDYYNQAKLRYDLTMEMRFAKALEAGQVPEAFTSSSAKNATSAGLTEMINAYKKSNLIPDPDFFERLGFTNFKAPKEWLYDNRNKPGKIGRFPKSYIEALHQEFSDYVRTSDLAEIHQLLDLALRKNPDSEQSLELLRTVGAIRDQQPDIDKGLERIIDRIRWNKQVRQQTLAIIFTDHGFDMHKFLDKKEADAAISAAKKLVGDWYVPFEKFQGYRKVAPLTDSLVAGPTGDIQGLQRHLAINSRGAWKSVGPKVSMFLIWGGLVYYIYEKIQKEISIGDFDEFKQKFNRQLQLSINVTNQELKNNPEYVDQLVKNDREQFFRAFMMPVITKVNGMNANSKIVSSKNSTPERFEKEHLAELQYTMIRAVDAFENIIRPKAKKGG